MTLGIVAVRDAGVMSKERLVLRANADCDIGKYLVIFTERVSGNVMGGESSAYWLPDKQVKSGDLIVIYTKSGEISEKDTKNGKSYFYYMNRKHVLFADINNVAVLGVFSGWRAVAPTIVEDDDEI